MAFSVKTRNAKIQLTDSVVVPSYAQLRKQFTGYPSLSLV